MLFNFSLRAPDFPSGFQWLNITKPLSLEQLRGQVVVLDFWTYCCINCIHILPDLKWLEDKYKDKQVVVIGVHSAKFKNEEKPENIQSAIDRYEIEHPVLIDESHQVWDSYAVRAWPTFVVIDTEGYIKGHFSGEGHREELDKLVHTLIIEGRRRKTLAMEPFKVTRPPETKRSTLKFPGKILLNPTKKEIFISDSNHNRIIHATLDTPTSATVKHVIGSGEAGSHDGTFAQATFYQPQGMCFTEDGLYVCDTENHLLRHINLTKQIVTTVAGTGMQSRWGAEGGPAMSTSLNSPWDITPAGNEKDKYFIAMAGAHQIWQFFPEEKKIDRYAGNGAENIVDGPRPYAQFAQPSGITAQGSELYVADSEVSAIRQVSRYTNEVTTVVGHGLFVFGHNDGPLEDALLQHAIGLTIEGHLIYVADTYNHAIRVIDLRKQVVTTLVKRMKKDVCMIGDKDCAVLPLNEPNDVKKMDHYLYIADTNNHLIRVLDLDTQTLSELQINGL